MRSKEIWFYTGSQHLYGADTLRQVDQHSTEIVDSLNGSDQLPLTIVFKKVLTTSEEITSAIREANYDRQCIGVVLWMHTFSPAKMWINGLKILHKPLLHLHTQFNRDIPWSTIDMDFMNLNQSAHGDRETAHLLTRMHIRRKTVVGHFRQQHVVRSIAAWSRAAIGWNDLQEARFVRFGDNMRFVAVTEGDKVEAELQFGFSVNTHGVGDLVEMINSVPESQVDHLCEEYAETYTLIGELQKGKKKHHALRDAARIEAGIAAFLKNGNYKGFTTTFEDLHGLVQLPGLAVQRLMQQGYGFAAEGDWKTSALVRMMKTMAAGLHGGNSFMEDYTYHFKEGEEAVLGAHMLEICPTITDRKPSCEVHALGIGGKADPVRLVFEGEPGPAINVCLVDMGDSFRLIMNDVEGITAPALMPALPVARVLWKPRPDIYTACRKWLEAGGAHHTCYSQNVTPEMMYDFALIAGCELVHISN